MATERRDEWFRLNAPLPRARCWQMVLPPDIDERDLPLIEAYVELLRESGFAPKAGLDAPALAIEADGPERSEG